MPRIAVAVMVVVTIGVSIGINIARFPVVWDMVSQPHRKAAPQQPAQPLPAPAMAAPRSEEVVDLGDFSPPPIHASSPERDAQADVSQSPLSNPTAPQGSDEQPSSPSPDDAGPVHLVSQPTTDTGTSSDDTPVPPRPESGTGGSEPITADSSPPGPLPATASPEGRPIEIASPIVFGPVASAAPTAIALGGAGMNPVVASGMAAGVGMAPAGGSGSTTWPAQVAPSLKLAARPLISDEEAAKWQEDRALAPIHRPGQRPAGGASLPGVGTSGVERLPRVLSSGPKPRWSSTDHRPEILNAIYPSTGK